MTVLRKTDVLPSFRLPEIRGTEKSVWDYKQRQPLVIVLCEAHQCEALLEHFASQYLQYREAGAEVLVITPTWPGKRNWPFPVLIDPERQASRCYAEHPPTVLIVDSYNALFERLEGPWTNGPDHAAILEYIAQMELQCPECGAPEWPQF